MSSSSDKNSSPDEDAAAVAAVAAAATAEQTPATVTPATTRKRKAAPPASATRDVIVECLRVGLGQIFDDKQVEAACKAILASSSVQELVLKLEEQPAGGKRRKAAGPEFKGRIRSAYTMFVTLMFAALKEAGVGASLPDVSGLWQALPDELRDDISARCEAIKDTHNAAVDAGQAPSLADALAAHEQATGLAPIDFMDVFERYKDSAKAAAAAIAAAGGPVKAKAKPGKKAAAAAPAAAAAAAPAAAPATEDKHKRHKRDKEKKKSKKDKGEADGGDKKKKKKHKRDKSKQAEAA